MVSYSTVQPVALVHRALVLRRQEVGNGQVLDGDARSEPPKALALIPWPR